VDVLRCVRVLRCDVGYRGLEKFSMICPFCGYEWKIRPPQDAPEDWEPKECTHCKRYLSTYKPVSEPEPAKEA
jgi:hypothetical protein